ncbi:PAS domain S-box protein, partial [Candidatus Dependentiae bacterium]|nr:PAS domain S-box protein [Candidatus Dependentiae bacterium]
MKESTDKIPDFDFTSFLNMVQEPIVILDKEKKIIYYNDLFLKETNFKDKDLLDKPFIELLHSEDKEYVQTRFIEKEKGDELSNGFLTRLIDNNGACRNIFMTCNLLIKQKELFGFCVTLKLSSGSGKFSEFFLRVQEISKSIAGTIEITELLTRICESIGRILDFPLVYVSLIHPDDKKLYPVAWHGKTRYFLKYENFVNLHNTENIPEYTVLKTGEILKLKLKDKLKSPYKAWLEILKSEKYTSYIGFPIIIKKKTEGVLNIFSEIPYIFGDSERVESLLTLTNFITVAIKNSRLFQKIIQAEERYRGLFYESPNGLCLINKDLQIHEINSIFLKMIGYSLKDFHVLSDFKKILTQNDYKKLNTFLNKSIETKRSYSFDSIINRREGEKRWVNLFISPLYDKFRNVIEFLLILRDVTEEKLSEFSILESEKKFRDLFENSSDVIFQIDKSGKLEKINNAFESISGYKVKNWIG